MTDFNLPLKPPKLSNIAYDALRLAALSSKLALEERTIVTHITGRAENVAEHSCMLAFVATVIAEKYYPKLDANLISRFAVIHDVVEAYVGDTPTHDITAEGLKEKEAKEQQGLAQLRKDYAELSSFVKLVEQYEAQELAEARFVRVIDKWTPVLVHFADEGATLRSYTDPQELVEDYKPRADKLKKDYPEFTELITVREDLTRAAAEYLFKTV